ncbi:MAG: BtaA family protein [Planctomycetota bacterium]
MLKEWLGKRCFSAVHRRNLVYNTCWEDPRLDREALALGSDDTVMVITSAGCNALDYALDAPKAVHAVDVNRLQNALLQLKRAAIKSLSYEDFFQVFGTGFHSEWSSLYQNLVRPCLSETDRDVWDGRQGFFDGSTRRKSFYYRGTSGYFAWMINRYIDRPKGLRDAVHEILSANSVEEQSEIYERRRVSKMLFSKPMKWALRRDATMALLGVPRSQRMQLDRGYPGGIGQFIQDRIEKVFREIPLKDNYFWRVYLTGSYTPECCPEYLRADGFAKLKDGLVDRVATHTETVESFLESHPERISRFVLLDHMDWLYEHHPDGLRSEWQHIVNRSTPDARVLWRSAAFEVDFVDPLVIESKGESVRLGELLTYQTELAESLHVADRVHTYGSFYIADVDGANAQDSPTQGVAA